MAAKKEITLNLPKKLVESLELAFPDEHLSGQIRLALDLDQVHPEVDLTELLSNDNDSKKKNLYMPLKQALDFEKEASHRGQSMSTYVVNLIANFLVANNYLDLSLRWVKPIETYEISSDIPVPRFEFSQPLIKLLSDNNHTQPYSSDWLSLIVLEYVDEVFGGKQRDIISVKGFYFHQRHKQPKVVMKINLPATIDNLLLQVSKRMGTTRMMVLTQALLLKFKTR